MNAIRWALGESQINYYGYSYGTYLGQVFANEYRREFGGWCSTPMSIPRVWYDANLDQDVAFETVIQLFFDWVGRHDNVYGLGNTRAAVQANYYAALNALAVTQRRAGRGGMDRRVPSCRLHPGQVARCRRGVCGLREPPRCRPSH